MRVGDTNLWGMEIDVAAAAEEIRNIGKADKGKGVEDVLGSFGLGAFADQLKDLRLSKRHSPNALWLFFSLRQLLLACKQPAVSNLLAIPTATPLLLACKQPTVPAIVCMDAKCLWMSLRGKKQRSCPQ